MVTMFVLMLAPMSGWYFATRNPQIEHPEQLSASTQEALHVWRDQVRRELAATFLVTVIVMGAGVLYARRSLIAPLAELAARARGVGQGPWQAPADLDRPDEIGDLGRALHGSMTTLEARAEEAVRFAVSLSHELRTPLAAIKGAAEILADADVPDADRARFVTNIATECARLERLVAGLLDLERARQGRPAGPKGRCDLAETVRASLERAAPLWSRKALEVDVQAQDSLPEIGSDADRVTRVLLGLLENAVKFSPRSGRIQVRIEAYPGGAQLIVEDEGTGVPDALKARIFDPTFVGNHGEGARGTGLGLTIVQSLVLGAGGSISVEDGTPGGARFVIRWPRAQAARGRAQTQA